MPRPLVDLSSHMTGHHTISFRKPGTFPPVYLAGSFTDPQWLPQEMKHEDGADGVPIFRTEVQVTPGQQYQFKFRIGKQGRWVLDDNSPVVTGVDGNENNLLTVPVSSGRGEPRVLHSGGVGDADYGTAEASTSDLLGDIPSNFAEKLDKPFMIETNIWNQRRDYDSPKPSAPLFAHECLGAYDVAADDRLDHSEYDETCSPKHSRNSSQDMSNYTFVDIDMNDPTIERFPSDRQHVLESIRKLQSSLNQDVPPGLDHPHRTPSSPPTARRRGSAESPPQNEAQSPPLTGSLPFRKRDSRASHGGFARLHSSGSLMSIAEEPRAGGGSDTKPRTLVGGGESEILVGGKSSNPDTPSSEADEGVVMKQTSLKPESLGVKTGGF